MIPSFYYSNKPHGSKKYAMRLKVNKWGLSHLKLSNHEMEERHKRSVWCLECCYSFFFRYTFIHGIKCWKIYNTFHQELLYIQPEPLHNSDISANIIEISQLVTLDFRLLLHYPGFSFAFALPWIFVCFRITLDFRLLLRYAGSLFLCYPGFWPGLCLWHWLLFDQIQFLISMYIL